MTPTPNARACFMSATSGRLVGGLCGCGGRKPYTSSNNTSARRRWLPGSERTRASTSSSSTPSTSARSSSSKCATLTITAEVQTIARREPFSHVERGPFAPAGERRRREQRVERRCQALAIGFRGFFYDLNVAGFSCAGRAIARAASAANRSWAAALVGSSIRRESARSRQHARIRGLRTCERRWDCS